MPSLDSLGRGLDGFVDDYLAAGTLAEAAAIIRSRPLLLTPAAARTVLAMTDFSDVERLGKARLIYRAELHGLARALQELHNPVSHKPIPPNAEIQRAHNHFRASKGLDQAIERLRPVPRLVGFADLDRDGRRQVEHMLGDLLLARYQQTPRREDLDEALVLLRRAFSAETTIGTTEALGEAEFETYLLTGEQQRLARAQELITDVLNQQDPSSARRPLRLVLYGRVQLAYYEEEHSPDALDAALLSAELAADLATDQMVANDVIKLAGRVFKAARSGGQRKVEASAGRLYAAVTARLGSLPRE
jgi:hypothetical protein